MHNSILKRFILFTLHPERGRIRTEYTRMRYCLIGAFLFDLLLKGEIKVEEKRLIPSIRRNGDPLHDTPADIIDRSPRPRKLSYWIYRLSWKSRFIMKQALLQLSSSAIVRHEKHYFLGFLSFNRYYLSDRRVQNDIIKEIREVLILNNVPSKEQMMMLSLIRASESEKILTDNREERKLFRRKIKEITGSYAGNSDSAIYEIQKAVMSAISNERATIIVSAT